MSDGGSAFPNDGAWGNGHPEGGMSLRDYFAAAALTSMLAPVQQLTEATPGRAAELSYQIADAMLAARIPSLPGAMSGDTK